MHPGIHAATQPDRPAVVMADSEKMLTYGELESRSARLAQVLRNAHFRRGDVVALLSPNSERSFEVYWAAMRSGMTLSPIDCSLSLEETAYLINDSGAVALVVSGCLAELASALRPLTPQVAFRYVFDGTVDGYESHERVMEQTEGGWYDELWGRELLYTAGVTGRPKGVQLLRAEGQPDDHRAGLSAVMTSTCEVGRDTVYVSTTPLSHSFSLQACNIVHAAGGTIVTMTQCSPEAVLQAIATHRADVVHLAPAMLVRLAKLPQEVRAAYDLASLKAVVLSSAPCPVEAKRQAIDWWGPIVHEFYICAERHGFTFIDADEWLRRPGSVGRSFLGTVHICDEEGVELPPGEVGLVYFEREETPFRYRHAPERAAAAQHPHHPNWTTADDLGRLDEEGFLYLMDRASSMITSGGVRVWPHEVEELLVMHSNVRDVAVIGVPDEELGEQVKGLVQATHGVDPSPDLEAELLDYARTHLPMQKVPRSIDFVGEVPRTASGKLIRRALARRSSMTDSVTA